MATATYGIWDSIKSFYNGNKKLVWIVGGVILLLLTGLGRRIVNLFR